jgi:hypothetical protein
MLVKDLLGDVRIGEATVLDIAGPPEARKLTVEMRKLLPEEPRPPKRIESPARVHEFLAAKSLAAYLARYGSKNTVVYADPANEVVYAVLDERADEGFEVVTMRPQKHPLWAPWADLADRHLEITDFAAFVSQNRRTVVAPDARDLVLTLSQVRAAVSIEIQKGRGKNAVNGLVVTTEIKGQRQADEVELPEMIKLHVPLYVQTEAKDVELDLCIEAGTDGEVSVVVTSGTIAEARVLAFEEMVAEIQAGLDGIGATLTFGRPQHRAWAYLAEKA